MRTAPTEREQKLRAKYYKWEGDHRGPCPVCGASLELLTAEERGWTRAGLTPDGYTPGKRYGVRHSWFDHKMAGIAPVGYAN